MKEPDRASVSGSAKPLGRDILVLTFLCIEMQHLNTVLEGTDVTKRKTGLIEEHALDYIPLEHRRPWYVPAGILAGVTACIPAMMVGYWLIVMLPLQQAIIATLIIYLIVGCGQTISAVRGQEVGRPLAVILRDALGDKGCRIVWCSIIAFVTLVWFGIQTELTANLFHAGTGTLSPATWTIILGIIMLLTAAVGFKMLDILNRVAVPALMLLTIWGIYYVGSVTGFGGIWGYQPQTPKPMLAGITLIVANMSFMMLVPADFTRYARSRRDAIISIWTGVVPVGIFLAVGGSVMGIIAGDIAPEAPYDISVALARLGFPAIAMIIIFLGSWTTNVSNAYGGGLALSSMLNLGVSGRFWVTVAGGAIGTVLGAFGMLSHVVGVSNITGVIAAPILGLLGAEIVLGRKWTERPGFGWEGIISWVVGAIVVILTAFLYRFFIPPINGSVVTFGLFIFLTKVSLAPLIKNGLPRRI